jgi:N-acetylglucosaminyldiphosphoundecaprenol N-acetyl-beta-D-mannosaminyltransferase
MIAGMCFNRKQSILGIGFDLVDYRAVFETFNRWRITGLRCYVSITNPHSVLLCHRDERMLRATSSADMTLPDGVGIILAANLLGYANRGRVTGPSLMLKLCDWGRTYKLRHYFYGGAEGVARTLAANLTKKYRGLRIAGTFSPPFRALSGDEDRQIVREINRARPDILWVGLGAPKQEIWMHEHLGRINATAMIGVGAAFDFHAGTVRWAPAWVRKAGFEWAYRLAREPRRLWRRNLDSPVFLAKVIWQRLMTGLRREAYFDSQAPMGLQE